MKKKIPTFKTDNEAEAFVDKADLTEYIGTLSKKRVRQILDGIRLLTEPRDAG